MSSIWLVTWREYACCQASDWSIGHMERIFLLSSIWLVTWREYSCCLASYWSTNLHGCDAQAVEIGAVEEAVPPVNVHEGLAFLCLDHHHTAINIHIILHIQYYTYNTTHIILHIQYYTYNTTHIILHILPIWYYNQYLILHIIEEEDEPRVGGPWRKDEKTHIFLPYEESIPWGHI
jgi:hypothetical protein